MIFRLENVEGERVAAFLDRVNDFLELGEQRLSKKGAANVVDLAVDDVGAHFFVGGFFEKMMGEQLFVKRRGDFGEKDGVIVVLVELRPLREPGMHRVAGFVGERVNVGKYIALVIHQDVRRRAETAR